MPEAAATRVVLLAGASGLIGRELLRGLLDDASVQTVHAVGRRPLQLSHAKLEQHVGDFGALAPLPAADECYITLGTTIKVAGSQAAFRAVDHDAVVAVAQAARRAGARRLGLVSAMGADPGARLFYSRVKGEAERSIASIGFAGLVIARPSVLAGDRTALGQPERRGERWMLAASDWLGGLVPANYRVIDARRVARALLRTVPLADGTRILFSGEIQKVGA